MNCKQGDLALVIRSNAANVGKLVRCLELLPPGSCNTSVENGPLWRVDREMEWDSPLGCTIPGCLAPDWALMPIRPLPNAETAETVGSHGVRQK
jgi:hypothetical protein